jgi:hypothetical protein
MNRTQAETLRALRGMLSDAGTPGPAKAGWARPLDIGGTSNSHHSNTLRRMVALGWVETDRQTPPARNSRPGLRYRITAKGREALANHDASVELARQAVIAAGERAKARG